MRKKRRKKGPVRSKKVLYDGITFASNLEKYMYQALKKARIRADYEGQTYTLIDGFEFKTPSYERQTNGKGEFTNRGCKKIQPIKYTPDFIGKKFIIETKGRANESFPMRWKLFKRFINRCYPCVTVYKNQKQKESDEVKVGIIKNKKK